MKKIILLGIAATAMLASCSNDDVVDVKAPNQAIGFSSFVEKATRGGEITTTSIDEFSVYGYADNSVIFNKEAVSKNGSDWTYTNIQYWVDGKTYNFHAFSPSGADWTWSANEDTADGSVKFTQKDGTQDLIYAYSNVNTGTVGFTFNHLLSRVLFRFENAFDATNAKLVVTDVTITDAYESGSVSVGSSNTTGRGTNGDGNAAGSAWENLDGTISPVFGAVNVSDNYVYSADASSEIAQGKKGVTDTKFIIPDPSAKAYTATFKLKVLASNGTNDVEYTKDITTTLPAVAMTPGFTYVYVAKLSADNLNPGGGDDVKLDPIKFSVNVVTEWVDGGEKELTKPE